jgi:hypothetical protein
VTTYRSSSGSTSADVPDDPETNLLAQYRFLRAVEFGVGFFALVYWRRIFERRAVNRVFLTVTGAGVGARLLRPRRGRHAVGGDDLVPRLGARRNRRHPRLHPFDRGGLTWSMSPHSRQETARDPGAR